MNLQSEESEEIEKSENILENAMDDLKKFLKKKKIEEPIETITFGNWGGDNDEENYERFTEDSPYFTPKSRIIPKDMKNKCLTEKEAEPFMKGWTFYNGYGYPQTYASYIWTTNHIIWVTEYDGSTKLDFAPRNPSNIIPYISGDDIDDYLDDDSDEVGEGEEGEGEKS